MDGKKEIVKILNSMSGRYSGYEIFSDWIRCLALSIEQSTHLIRNKDWQDREQAYLDTIKRYTPEEQTQFAVMTAHLIETLEEVKHIQDEGRTRRAEAEMELGRIEGELKQKLLDMQG